MPDADCTLSRGTAIVDDPCQHESEQMIECTPFQRTVDLCLGGVRVEQAAPGEADDTWGTSRQI
jgi:hypothetical protein